MSRGELRLRQLRAGEETEGVLGVDLVVEPDRFGELQPGCGEVAPGAGQDASGVGEKSPARLHLENSLSFAPFHAAERGGGLRHPTLLGVDAGEPERRVDLDAWIVPLAGQADDFPVCGFRL